MKIISFVGACALAFNALQAQAQSTAQAGKAIDVSQDRPMTLMSAVLPTSDLAKSTAFYTQGLGLIAARGANPREVVLTFPGGGANLMLLQTINTPGTARPGPSKAILLVPDLKALTARLSAAGYALKGPISENARFHISIAQLEDPDGNSLELLQRGG